MLRHANAHAADFASALSLEIRRGAGPEIRNFLRIKFKNGSNEFQTYHAFGHKADIPVTEFVYKLEVRLHRFVFRVAVGLTCDIHVNDRTTPSHLRSSGMLRATFRMTLIRLRMIHLQLCLLPLRRCFSLVWWCLPSLSGLALMRGLASTGYEVRSMLFDVCSPSVGCIP